MCCSLFVVLALARVALYKHLLAPSVKIKNLFVFALISLVFGNYIKQAVAVYPEQLLEAQLIALDVSGELEPHAGLTQQIMNDLAAIRAAYPEVADIAYLPRFVPDEIMVGLTPQAVTQFREGQYHALDALNSLYGVVEIDSHLLSFIGVILLKFDRIYNTELLSELYEQAGPEGVRYVEANYMVGDGSTITIYANPPDYTFREAWGDCPAGCIEQKLWHFRVENGQVSVLPVTDAEPNQLVYAWIDGIADAALDASALYGTNDYELSYLWTWSIDGYTYETHGVRPTIELPVGKHTIELMVSDGTKNRVVITVVEPIEGQMKMTPRTVNWRSKKPKITAMLWLPAGVSKQDIDSNSTILLYPGEIEANYQSIMRYYKRGVERVVILARFDRQALLDVVGDAGWVQLDVIGQLKTGQYFFGSDMVRTINPPRQLPDNWQNRYHSRTPKKR